MTAIFRTAIALVALTLPAAVQAASKVALNSTIFVERDTTDAHGRRAIVLEPPRTVSSGDRLVFLLDYRNTGARAASDVVVTNPMPRGVAYQGADANALVSIDGGRRWGPLASFRVTERDGSVRSARPEDVTHIRWAMKQALAAGDGGKLSFRGVVR